MLALFFRLMVAFLAFRLIGGAVRAMRSRPSTRGSRGTGEAAQPDKPREYSDLTPYDIEEAEYEDLTGREQ